MKCNMKSDSKRLEPFFDLERVKITTTLPNSQKNNLKIEGKIGKLQALPYCKIPRLYELASLAIFYHPLNFYPQCFTGGLSREFASLRFCAVHLNC